MAAMTSNQLQLINAIANNDMPKARAYARCCVAGETFRYYLSSREAELFGYIDRMRRVCGELAQLGISRPNTTLLHGASGTGKTTFGRYVAAMFDLPFYYVNFSRLIDSYLGKTSRNIAEVFDYVRTIPCVLMLDDAHIGYDREELIAFCDANPRKSQAWLIGIAVEEIARAIEGRQTFDGEQYPPCNALETGIGIFKLSIFDTTSENNGKQAE